MKAMLPLHRRTRVWYGVRRDAASAAGAASAAPDPAQARVRILVQSLYGRDLPPSIRRTPAEPSAEVL